RARDRRRRRDFPRRDLAALHGAGSRRNRAPGLPRAGRLAGVEAVHARQVRVDLRPEPRGYDRYVDSDRDAAHAEDGATSVQRAVRREPLSPRVADLLTIGEALARVLEHVQPLPVEDVPLDDSLGRVVREPARAAVDLPPFPSSAMDGFAVRSSDTPGELAVAFRVAAGSAPPGALPAGAAA